MPHEADGPRPHRTRLTMATNVLIAFYSRGGATKSLAKAIAEGAIGEGAEVRLRRARELVGAELMAMVPGWSDSAARQNALYRLRRKPMPSGPMPSCWARPRASARSPLS